MPRETEQPNVQYVVLWQMVGAMHSPVYRDCRQTIAAAYERRSEIEREMNRKFIGIIEEPLLFQAQPKLGPYQITKGKTIPNLPLGACSPRPQKIIHLTHSSSANAVFALDSSGQAWRATNWQNARGWTWELIGGNGS